MASQAQAAVAGLGDGDVALLENLRFNTGETSKDEAERDAFATQLAQFADVYVDDAFGAVHRKHASVFDVAALLPRYAGGLVLRELDVLSELTGDPERPYVVILGGSKVSDKLAVIEALLPKVDKLLIGGGMCFTFLKAQGHEVGKSLLQDDMVGTCADLLARAGDKIVLPIDVVTADKFAADAETQVVAADAIPAEELGLDIGPDSVVLFAQAVEREDRVLERPDGRLRARAVRGRHPWCRRGDHEDRRFQRGRRRRLGRGRACARHRRGRVQPHLDRWRRIPGVPRGQGPARHHRTGGLSHG